MISPTKYMSLDDCLLKAIVIIIKHLQSAKIEDLYKLRERLQKEIKLTDYKLDETMLNALSILYMLDKIEYLTKNDSIKINL